MLSGGQMILGGLLMLVVAFVLRRSFSQSKVSRTRDPLREARQEIHQAESSYAGAINKMELRLHEYAREVEARIDTKITVLDRLIVAAEQKIQRLEELSQPAAPAEAAEAAEPPRLISDGQRVIYQLADLGLSAAEIAERISEPASHVRLILKMRPDANHRDAA